MASSVSLITSGLQCVYALHSQSVLTDCRGFVDALNNGAGSCLKFRCKWINFHSFRTNQCRGGAAVTSYSHGEEKATSSHSRNGSEDPGVPRAQVPAAGFPEIRPGLWNDETALHGEDAARVGLAGCSQGEPPLLPAGGHEAVRSGPPLHPQVLVGGPHRAQLLADHQGQGGLHVWGESGPHPFTVTECEVCRLPWLISVNEKLFGSDIICPVTKVHLVSCGF